MKTFTDKEVAEAKRMYIKAHRNGSRVPAWAKLVMGETTTWQEWLPGATV